MDKQRESWDRDKDRHRKLFRYRETFNKHGGLATIIHWNPDANLFYARLSENGQCSGTFWRASFRITQHTTKRKKTAFHPGSFSPLCEPFFCPFLQLLAPQQSDQPGKGRTKTFNIWRVWSSKWFLQGACWNLLLNFNICFWLGKW